MLTVYLKCPIPGQLTHFLQCKIKYSLLSHHMWANLIDTQTRHRWMKLLLDALSTNQFPFKSDPEALPRRIIHLQMHQWQESTVPRKDDLHSFLKQYWQELHSIDDSAAATVLVHGRFVHVSTLSSNSHVPRSTMQQKFTMSYKYTQSHSQHIPIT